MLSPLLPAPPPSNSHRAQRLAKIAEKEAKKMLNRTEKNWLTDSYTVKKRLAIFPSPAGMSLTILSLAGNN
jgi:hypothetical protein